MEKFKNCSAWLVVMIALAGLLVACEKEAEGVMGNIEPQTRVANRRLVGEELEAYLDWAAHLDSSLVINVQETDSTAMDTVYVEENEIGGGSTLGVVLRPKLYCVYTVAAVQGGMCGGMPPAGGTICIYCNSLFPQGGCPNYNGKQLNCWSGGNIVCTMTVVGSLGIACDRCPMGGYTTEVIP